MHQPNCHGYRNLTARRFFYKQIRESAYKTALKQMQGVNLLPPHVLGLVRIVDIDDEALAAQETWPSDRRLSSAGRGQWNWRRYNSDFNKSASALRVAIWHDKLLCALIAGRLSQGKVSVRIHLLQGIDASHPLKGEVSNIMFLVAKNYADALSCSEITIEKPYQEVIGLYETLGFSRCERHGKRQPRMVRKLEK